MLGGGFRVLVSDGLVESVAADHLADAINLVGRDPKLLLQPPPTGLSPAQVGALAHQLTIDRETFERLAHDRERVVRDHGDSSRSTVGATIRFWTACAEWFAKAADEQLEVFLEWSDDPPSLCEEDRQVDWHPIRYRPRAPDANAAEGS